MNSNVGTLAVILTLPEALTGILLLLISKYNIPLLLVLSYAIRICLSLIAGVFKLIWFVVPLIIFNRSAGSSLSPP